MAIARGKPMWRIAVLALTLTLACAPAYGSKVDNYVRKEMASGHVPGVSVGVIREGKLVLAKGYGLANVELPSRATPDTVYETLSITKQFTAAAILMLVEQGKLSLDGRISRYLPDLPTAWEAITVRHLLTHTSGIRDFTDVPGWFGTIRMDRTPEELVNTTKTFPLPFQPGDAFRYCNAGYYLLAMILEKVSGQSYADFLRERIFQPLGMTATRVNDLKTIVPHRASGYHWENSGLQHGTFVSPTQKWAAGAVISTVRDLAKWDAALYTEKLLKRETLRQMWTPARLNDGQEAPYGFGNELDSERGHRVAGHQGGGVSFNVTLLRYPEDRLTVIVLCNETRAPSRRMARRIASFYLPELSYEKLKDIPDTEPQVTEMLKTLLLDLAAGKAELTLFSPAAQAALVPFLKRVGPGYLGRLGPLQSLVLLERTEEKASRVYRYRATYKDSSVLWALTLTQDGKIADLKPIEE